MDICQIDYGAVANWIAALSTAITAWIAFRALNNWRQQKHYDVLIEALAYVEPALSYIQSLRNNIISNAEILPDVQKGKEDDGLDLVYSKEPLKHYYIFLSRRKAQIQLFDTIRKLRQKVWATYGSNHLLTKYFSSIVKMDQKLIDSHFQFLQKFDDPGLREDERKKELSTLKGIMYSYEEDEWEIKAEEMLREIEGLR